MKASIYISRGFSTIFHASLGKLLTEPAEYFQQKIRKDSTSVYENRFVFVVVNDKRRCRGLSRKEVVVLLLDA